MVIVCDKCETRFHLAEGRIGPNGAKVRCSNCHHRFHVRGQSGDATSDNAQTGVAPSPQEQAIQDSADALAQAGAEPELGAEPEPSAGAGQGAGAAQSAGAGQAAEVAQSAEVASAAAGAGEQTRDDRAATALEPDLENPEFLFDEPAGEASMSGGLTLDAGIPGGGDSFANALTRPADPALAEELAGAPAPGSSVAEAAPPQSSARPNDARDVPGAHAPDDGHRAQAEAIDELDGAEEGESPGEPTPVFGVDPGVSARQQQLRGGPSAGAFEIERNGSFESDASSDSLDAAGFAESPETAGGRPGSGSWAEASPEPAAGAAAVPGAIGSVAAELGALDDDDELADWDPLADADGGSDPDEVPAARPSPPSLRESSGAGGARTERATGLSTSRSRPRSQSESPEATPTTGAQEEAVERGGFTTGLLAAAAAALLLAGGVRAALVWGLAGTGGPSQVGGAGWVASGIRSHTVRDPADRAVLVVRGALRAQTPDAIPPRIELTALDGRGQALSDPRAARLERLEDRWLAPEPLAEMLAKASAPLAAPVTGFTVLLPDPPAGTRRFVLALRPGPGHPRGTRRAQQATPPGLTPGSAPSSAPGPALAHPPARDADAAESGSGERDGSGGRAGGAQSLPASPEAP